MEIQHVVSIWWLGQVGKLIGLTKQSSYKSLGRTVLRQSEVKEVLLDVIYIEEDVQYPVSTI